MEAIVGKTYRHYKNKKLYKVICLGIHSETGEEMVVYEGQYDDDEYGLNPIWIRPRKIFEETVEVDSVDTERFTVVDEDESF